jgi:hypothetical protein
MLEMPVKPQQFLFNSSIESGLRSLCLLFEGYPLEFDLQRIVFFDYLLVHSGDAPNGPPSLHPPTPFRSNEFLVRRHLIESGLHLLMSRGLITVNATSNGFLYRAADPSVSFLAELSADYTAILRERAAWVVEYYGETSDGQLSAIFNENLDRWGSEFEIVGDLEEGQVQ